MVISFLKNMFLTKKRKKDSKLKIDSAVSSEGQGKLTFYVLL
jgi:hypothetical protein